MVRTPEAMRTGQGEQDHSNLIRMRLAQWPVAASAGWPHAACHLAVALKLAHDDPGLTAMIDGHY